MPEAVNQGQMLHLTKANTLSASQQDIFACFVVEQGKILEITANMNSYRNKIAHYYIIDKRSYTANRGILSGPVGFSYVDLMVKGVTERFIDITFKGYEKAAGKEFGKTVPGLCMLGTSIRESICYLIDSMKKPKCPVRKYKIGKGIS